MWLLRYSSAKYWFSSANWGDQLADVISSLMIYVKYLRIYIIEHTKPSSENGND
jgi:hypothetical protein